MHIFGGAFIVQLCIFWRFNIIVQGNFGQEIEGKIFEKSKIIESMLGGWSILYAWEETNFHQN